MQMRLQQFVIKVCVTLMMIGILVLIASVVACSHQHHVGATSVFYRV